MRTSARLFLVVFVLAAVAGFTLLSSPHAAVSQAVPTAIAGYGWSGVNPTGNTGYISFNCMSDPGGCTGPAGNWGLAVDPSGNISGYAWSDNIGWISANSSDLSGCPTAPCTATLVSGTLSGWFKALSADGNGWDGWISLSGSSPNYGPQVIGSGNYYFSGFAWGSDVLGWIDFSKAYTPCTPSTVYSCTGPGNLTIASTTIALDCTINTTNIQTCVAPNFCSTGVSTCVPPTPKGTLTVTPNLTTSGATVTVTWNASGVTSCTVTGSNGDGTGSNGTGVWNTTSGSQTSSAITGPTVYTLNCVPGPYVITATVGLVPVVHYP